MKATKLTTEPRMRRAAASLRRDFCCPRDKSGDDEEEEEADEERDKDVKPLPHQKAGEKGPLELLQRGLWDRRFA